MSRATLNVQIKHLKDKFANCLWRRRQTCMQGKCQIYSSPNPVTGNLEFANCACCRGEKLWAHKTATFISYLTLPNPVTLNEVMLFQSSGITSTWNINRNHHEICSLFEPKYKWMSRFLHKKLSVAAHMHMQMALHATRFGQPVNYRLWPTFVGAICAQMRS